MHGPAAEAAHSENGDDAGKPGGASVALGEIKRVAADSACARYDWPHERGVGPRGYFEGLALTYARAVCHPERADVKAASGAEGSPERDALRWYQDEFATAGLSNDAAGRASYRHTYALMVGLGMQESSGQYCTGRDRDNDYDEADSAESGLFQTSWGVSEADPSLPALFAYYKAHPEACLRNVFATSDDGPVRCAEGDAENFGDADSQGFQWQALTKACPAFAADYAAVVMRKEGGADGEFGTIAGKHVAFNPECDAMLQDVERVVAQHPEVCGALPSPAWHSLSRRGQKAP